MNKAEKEFSEKRGQFWLWLGFLLPPVVWIIQLQTVYLTSEYGCGSNNFQPNNIVSVLALMFSIIGGLISWWNWLDSGRKWKSEEAGTISRSRFMSILGMLTSGLFTLVIFAQWLPTLVGVPCQK
jgi:protein-S-isoprenylcysteine O-methyltransferase Ste14